MEQQQTSPQPPATLPAIRHDGWTGEKMAIFCEALAETAVVAEACDAARMGISGAYAARRRSAVFAAAWDAALSIARERLADTLLARSMEGNVEQIYRDGELVGERHFLDNRLGLAILRRLDRLADAGARSCEPRSPGQTKAPDPGVRRGSPIDWTLAVEALRTGDDASVARALALVDSTALSAAEGNEVEEVEGDPNRPLRDCEDEGLDLSGRCWTADEMGEIVWYTNFPPPPDFDGEEKGAWGDYGYERECTPEETELLAAAEAATDAEERAAEERLRDAWFAMLRAEQAEQAEQAELAAAGELRGAEAGAGVNAPSGSSPDRR